MVQQAELVLFKIASVLLLGERHILVEGVEFERLEIHDKGIKERNMELRNSGKERLKAFGEKISAHFLWSIAPNLLS
jgi:hypothetical protein